MHTVREGVEEILAHVEPDIGPDKVIQPAMDDGERGVNWYGWAEDKTGPGTVGLYRPSVFQGDESLGIKSHLNGPMGMPNLPAITLSML